MNRLAAALTRAPALGIVLVIRAYQITISPWLGHCCRYTPSCSHYFIACVEKYGALRGSWRGVGRLCRCHPFHPGGYDPP
jgi:hypothetical protein